MSTTDIDKNIILLQENECYQPQSGTNQDISEANDLRKNNRKVFLIFGSVVAVLVVSLLVAFILSVAALSFVSAQQESFEQTLSSVKKDLEVLNMTLTTVDKVNLYSRCTKEESTCTVANILLTITGICVKHLSKLLIKP